MKKYFLSPDWDVVPRNGGVEISGPETDAPLLLQGEWLRELFSVLCTGGLGRQTLRDSYGNDVADRIIKELLATGAVQLLEDKTLKREPHNYLDLLESSVVGPGRIVRRIDRIPLAADSPFRSGFRVSYSAGFGPRLIRNQSSLSGGWGADRDPLLADIKSAVEAVERYALGEYDLSGFTAGSWESMRDEAMAPAQLGATSEQLSKATYWQRLDEISGTGRIFAPIDFLHHPIDYTELGRLPVAPLNISGVAGHQSREAATVNALLELCEHEALMVAWYGRRQSATISHDSLDSDSQNYVRWLGQMGWRVILKDVSLDLVPVVMAVALGPPGKRALTIGSCAAFSSRYAAGKALTEVVRTILTDEADNPEFPLLKREQVNDVLTHGLYYARPENLAEASRLWKESGIRETNAEDLLTDGSNRTLQKAQRQWEADGSLAKAELAYLLGILGRSGIRAYGCEITPRQVRDKGVPLFVIRAIAPEMARMTVGYGREPAQTLRFTRLLRKYGHGRIQRPIKTLHPFS